MANARISELATATALTGAELFEVVQGGLNKKITAAEVVGGAGGAEHFRGNYDASGDAYPSSGGSGTAGAISAGDEWLVTVGTTAGLPGGIAIGSGDKTILKAIVNSPGNTLSDWKII